MNAAVSAAKMRFNSLWRGSSGKNVFAWRTTLRQLLISPPHSVRASFHRKYDVSAALRGFGRRRDFLVSNA